jgi:hypothetical protein
VLGEYDAFQYRYRVKPDYSNAGGLSVYEDGEWVDWYDDDGNDIDSPDIRVGLMTARAAAVREKAEAK